MRALELAAENKGLKHELMRLQEAYVRLKEVHEAAMAMWKAEDDEIERLREQVEALHQVASECYALRAERDALKADAERYRWLRSLHWSSGQMAVVVNPRQSLKLGSNCPSEKLLDDAIDSALRGEGE